jgi:hypothetical protein
MILDDAFICQRRNKLIHRIAISNKYWRFAYGSPNRDALANIVFPRHFFSALREKDERAQEMGLGK